MSERRYPQRHGARDPASNNAAIINHPTNNHALQASQQHYYYNDYPYYYYYPYPPDETVKFIGIIPWTLKMLRILAIGMMLLSSSVTLYGVFYWAVMPGNYASRPLFFDYTGTVDFPHPNITKLHFNHSKQQQQQPKEQTTTKSSSSSNTQIVTTEKATESAEICTSYTPWATVDLFAKEEAILWGETIHEELIPPQQTNDRILQPKQAYYVEVHLTLPESEMNRNVGMFGVAVDLLSQQPSKDENRNTTTVKLASSVRSARLPHESGWVAVARKLVWLVPLVFGGIQENRVVIVSSFRHIVESQEYPLVSSITFVAVSFLLSQYMTLISGWFHLNGCPEATCCSETSRTDILSASECTITTTVERTSC